MSARSPHPILQQHRILRENRPVRVGVSDSAGCQEHSGDTPVVRLISDSTNPGIIEVICLCGQRLEIELLYHPHD